MQFFPPDRMITKSPALQKHLQRCLPNPKKYFGRIAKENGILVPTIYDSCKDMKKAASRGEKAIIRSEWKLELAYSGLLCSVPGLLMEEIPADKSEAIELVKKHSIEDRDLAWFARAIGIILAVD